MARKSRKNVMLQENTALPDKEKKVLFKAGLYARLSHEKEENIERGTIETQLHLCFDCPSLNGLFLFMGPSCI